MTILEVIRRSTEFLAKRGVESPRLQIELLLAHVLQMPRLKLYLNFERTLTPAELDAVRALTQRRGRREPLQHLVGSVSFCSLELAVNRHVLVPRPESEILAERAWKFLQARSLSTLNSPPADRRAGQPSTVLDFGTGSGCLAIALAVNCPAAQIHAVDISQEALVVARDNAARHKVTERIQFHEGDGFGALPHGLQFDLLVANPPYIASAEIATLEPEVSDYDPRLALDGGGDGLDFYRRLAREAVTFLRPEGRMMLEFGDGQAARLAELLRAQNWIVEAVEPDYSGRERILIARRAEA